MRSVALAVTLFRSSVVVQSAAVQPERPVLNSSNWEEDVIVIGLAAAGIIDEEPVEEIIDLCVEAFQAIGKAFTHSRTISVAVAPSAGNRPTGSFQRSDEYKDDGVKFGWEHTDAGMVMTYHNNGPISGCQGFILSDCQWRLYVAASNPLIGKNKVRVAFYPPHTTYHHDCHSVWHRMNGFGEQDGNAFLNRGVWHKEDNPSTIAYTIDLPHECRDWEQYKEKVWLGETDFPNSGVIDSFPHTSDDDAFQRCKETDTCRGWVSDGDTVWLKEFYSGDNDSGDNDPTHNANTVTHLMAQESFHGVNLWWKVLRGIRLGHEIDRIDSCDEESHTRDALAQQCEEMSGCDAFLRDAPRGFCYFYDFSQGIHFSEATEEGWTAYIAEKNPWSDAAVIAADEAAVV